MAHLTRKHLARLLRLLALGNVEERAEHDSVNDSRAVAHAAG